MDSNYQAIYLAALLHDIGKFWYRAYEDEIELSNSTIQHREILCPKHDSGISNQKHPLYTYQFLKNNSSLFTKTLNQAANKLDLSQLASSSFKLNPQASERAIQYANIISSGTEQLQLSEKQENLSLLNPFDKAYRLKEPEKRSHYPIKKLQFNDTIFARSEQGNNIKSQYRKLWEQFEEEVGKLPQGSFSAQATTLLNLLEKYTWCVPYSTHGPTDISLYDHLKTTAAIAGCLSYSTQSAEYGALPESFDVLEDEKGERFALLVGDFSGIQKFIYQLSSKGAAKTLKGRSFYLQLLQDSVLDVVKQVFAIEDAHVLLNTGGRFQVLLPNNKRKLEKVQRFIDQTNVSLRKQFGDAIYLAIGSKSFAVSQLMIENGFSKLVGEAYKNAEKDKSHKFARVIDQDFFALGSAGGAKSNQICHVTGLDLHEGEGEELEDGLVVSPAVFEQIQLGQWLKNAAYRVKQRRTKFELWKQELCPLHELFKKSEYAGTTYRIYKKGKLTKEKYDILLESERIIEVSAINDTNFMRFSEPDSPTAHSFMLYGAAWTPDDVNDEDGESRPVDFSDIAEDKSNDLMAVLRLDVDNLGQLFREGIGAADEGSEKKQVGNISRFSSMSQKLDFFFSGYMSHLLTKIYQSDKELGSDLISGEFKNESPNQHIFPVYAGGDDVFIVCRWDIAPQLANRIYRDFKRFTNEHEEMSLSGGVRMVHGKYPIHKAALEAEQAEHKAKTFTTYNADDRKDAFCMFGQAMGWKDFCFTTRHTKQLLAWQKQMETKTLLGFLRQLYGEYHERYHYGRWRWRSAYQLKRIGKQHEMEDEMCKLASWLFSGQKEELKRVEILPKNEHYTINRPPELVDITGFTAQWLHQLTRNKNG